MIAAFIGVAFDGIAYGGLLFLISLGLSVTLGLMNFINLAHGTFAMMGGFLCVELIRRAGVPFLATLPLVFLAVALAGVVLERLLYRRLYRRGHLDQVLFTIGLTLMAQAAATWIWGPSQQPVTLPPAFHHQVSLLGVDIGVYRLFLIGCVAVVTAALGLLLARTRFGTQLRAAVDHPQAAAGSGINVELLFSVTFALGSGLAGLGGALAIDVLGLDPTFAFKYLVYFLIVVGVGGVGSLRGPLLAALLLGVVDIAGKYYVPRAGSFGVYAAMVALLALFPAGLHGRRA
jgi:branched-chain amino acid transport system permease protein